VRMSGYVPTYLHAFHMLQNVHRPSLYFIDSASVKCT
jgi:hypothetical protein